MSVEDLRAEAAVLVLDVVFELPFPAFFAGDVAVLCPKLTLDQVEETIKLLIDMKDVRYAPEGRGGSFAVNR